MRALFLFFFLLYFCNSAFSQVKKTLFVHAENGLVMRKEPATAGDKLFTLPYGSKIQLLSEEKFGKELEVKELSNWNIKGQWLYVTYKGQDGYVFEGFTSWLPTPVKNYNEHFIDYFLKQIGIDGEKKKILYFNSVSKTKVQCGIEQKLKLEILYKFGHCEGDTDEEEVFIPNSELQEVYLLCKKIYFNDKTDEIEFNPNKKEIIIFSKENAVSLGYSLTIKRFKNGITLESYFET